MFFYCSFFPLAYPFPHVLHEDLFEAGVQCFDVMNFFPHFFLRGAVDSRPVILLIFFGIGFFLPLEAVHRLNPFSPPFKESPFSSSFDLGRDQIVSWSS